MQDPIVYTCSKITIDFILHTIMTLITGLSYMLRLKPNSKQRKLLQFASWQPWRRRICRWIKQKLRFMMITTCNAMHMNKHKWRVPVFSCYMSRNKIGVWRGELPNNATTKPFNVNNLHNPKYLKLTSPISKILSKPIALKEKVANWYNNCEQEKLSNVQSPLNNIPQKTLNNMQIVF